jgi:hypothetical protein
MYLLVCLGIKRDMGLNAEDVKMLAARYKPNQQGGKSDRSRQKERIEGTDEGDYRAKGDRDVLDTYPLLTSKQLKYSGQ